MGQAELQVSAWFVPGFAHAWESISLFLTSGTFPNSVLFNVANQGLTTGLSSAKQPRQVVVSAAGCNASLLSLASKPRGPVAAGDQREGRSRLSDLQCYNQENYCGAQKAHGRLPESKDLLYSIMHMWILEGNGCVHVPLINVYWCS